MRINLLVSGIASVAVFMLAPGMVALGQGATFDWAAGDNKLENNTKEFELLGQKFVFARNIEAAAFMSRLVQQPNGLTVVQAGAAESESVTVFSNVSHLLAVSTGGSGSSMGGFTGSFDLKIFPAGGEGVEQSLTAPAPYSLGIDLSSTNAVSVSPKFTIEHDFGVISIPAVKFKGVTIVPKMDISVGKVGVDFQLDASVIITERVKGDMIMAFPGAGIDLKGDLAVSTKTKLKREVQILKIGFLVFEAKGSVDGKATLDFGKFGFVIDAHPRFDNLKGKATSKIDQMDISIGGKIKANISIQGHSIGERELYDLPKWEFPGPGADKVLFDR